MTRSGRHLTIPPPILPSTPSRVARNLNRNKYVPITYSKRPCSSSRRSGARRPPTIGYVPSSRVYGRTLPCASLPSRGGCVDSRIFALYCLSAGAAHQERVHRASLRGTRSDGVGNGWRSVLQAIPWLTSLRFVGGSSRVQLVLEHAERSLRFGYRWATG